MSDKLQVVMSPVQLAAVLSDKTVTEAETLQNRLLGGLGVAMSTVELAGAAILCAAPDPTTLTKAACIVVGAHGLDSLNAAIDQTLTGHDTRTTAYQLAVDTARRFGADEKTAINIGLTVDIAVPIAFGLALGAVRVASVRIGRIRLMEHESVAGYKPGGHTLSRHVGLSEADLRTRLRNRPTLSGSSTFYNKHLAEDVISRALKFNAPYITNWAKTARASSKLNIDFFAGREVGFGIESATGPVIKSYKMRVVLELQMYNEKPYYVLTAFPILR
ncbi:MULTISPECIES: RNase A-like domain-containing protein [Pseudescherichia]|jgi:hypothetical protein|uniref:RNase A-like domain-containing protein n=1 Tax=Pseudescherichia TaxID=2055880 RepID=UPI00214FD357|nr:MULTISPECIES: RNase A-like domain-containing protein [unclassified Pseudescherichia]MCR4457246.1 hypothetical protein [Pseudescherichia sp. L3]MDF2777830.1 hypothetical protein [Enterobacteriaceae bacterium]